MQLASICAINDEDICPEGANQVKFKQNLVLNAQHRKAQDFRTIFAFAKLMQVGLFNLQSNLAGMNLSRQRSLADLQMDRL